MEEEFVLESFRFQITNDKKIGRQNERKNPLC